MYWRRVRDAELEACLAIEPRHIGAELVGRDKALLAWRWLTQCPAFNNAVILADSSPCSSGILGYGAAAFVTSAFTDAELATPRPGLNARFIAAVAGGVSPVLDIDQVRDGNTHAGLDILCLLGVYPRDLGRERALEVLSFMAAAFVEHHAGYRINRMITESIGEIEIAMFLSTHVWRCIQSFESATAEETALYGRDRALFFTSRDESLAVPTSNTIPLFRYSEPVLRLRGPEQELLNAALRDLTDEELARDLNVHVGTIKKRWLEIYSRVSEARPELVLGRRHSDGERTRGKQKRHLILAYIREHPEELRPYEHAEPAPRGAP
jgi:hypothetical protein